MDNRQQKLVYIIAGEPSGDLLASRLMQALHDKDPGIRFAGMGGETMIAMGFESLFDISEISVMGIMEVVPKLRVILRRVKQVVADIREQRPDVVVTVDSWGFVHQVLARLKKEGCKIPKVHYVAPQVWAWKKGRAKTVARLVDRLMALLPYEPPYFEKYGLNCTFVGHPVIETTANLVNDPVAFKVKYGIPEQCTLMSVLPGSRHSEIKRLIPVFRQALLQLKKTFPDLYVVIPSVAAISREVEAAFADLEVPHRIIMGQYERYAAFQASMFALAASGTVSLELTAFGIPHVIAYRFGYVTNKILKHFAGTKYANLINILADKFVIPEFVLENCREPLITPKVLDLMQQSDKAKAQMDEAQQYLLKLKPGDMTPSQKAAETVWSVIGQQVPKY
ncbi:MAG: lipid-A-disaccharide synthase [Bacteroidales bacterium]|nr:lipid-A-disaccharide synthase [Bacteroidales bacterium]